jgi:translation initiation factor 3 subunit B
MKLLDNNSIKVPGVRDFEWAPARIPGEKKAGAVEQHMLCYWTPEQGNSPAKVALLNIPSKEVVSTKNLFNVSDVPSHWPPTPLCNVNFVKCKLHWQSNSEFLCVKVDRHTKSKKTSFTNLEIFHVREKSIPVEVIEVKDTVIAFAWEPKGERFTTVMTADVVNPERGPAGLRTNINFYMLEKGSKSAVINNFKLMRTRPQAPSPLRYFN